MIIDIITVTALMLFPYLLGYLTGRRHQKQVCDEAEERLASIEPPTRAAGQPTNVDGPPSRINQPKWRQGMLRGGDAHND